MLDKIWKHNPQKTKLPTAFIAIAIFICLFPSICNLFGIDFGTPGHPLDTRIISTLADSKLTDTLHHSLAGSFTHTILEWSAFCTAIFTVILAFVYFHSERDVTTPIIAVALFCAGIMDAFHTLAADRLIEVVADNQNLIPFTWALCRLCNIILTLIGASLFLVSKPQKLEKDISFILIISLLFGLVAYGIIHFCAVSTQLPATTFPNSIITRPWDVAPLILFAIAGLFVYPKFYSLYPSLFSHALIVSTIPNVFVQAHMAFGSTALFDNHFNIAHFLKIIAYLIPLTGLVLDYSYTHQAVKHANHQLSHTIAEQEKIEVALRQSEILLKRKNQKLKQALGQLKQAQSQLIQAEQMSGLGQIVGGIAYEINNPVNFICGNISHVKTYLEDLLKLLQLYRDQYPQTTEEIEAEIENIELDFLLKDLPKTLSSMKMGTDRIRQIVLSLRNFSRLDEAECKDVDLHDGLESTLVILNHRLKQGIAIVKEYGDLPLIECYPSQLNQVWMNCLSNAIDALESTQAIARKSHSESRKTEQSYQITIKTQKLDSQTIQITIGDNGPGIPAAIVEKIFAPFFTTKPIGKGTGLGLSICYQIVDKHGGAIEVSSQPGKGTIFTIALPIKQPQFAT